MKLIEHAASYFALVFQTPIYHLLSHQEVFCELDNFVGKMLTLPWMVFVLFENLGMDSQPCLV